MVTFYLFIILVNACLRQWGVGLETAPLHLSSISSCSCPVKFSPVQIAPSPPFSLSCILSSDREDSSIKSKKDPTDKIEDTKTQKLQEDFHVEHWSKLPYVGIVPEKHRLLKICHNGIIKQWRCVDSCPFIQLAAIHTKRAKILASTNFVLRRYP